MWLCWFAKAQKACMKEKKKLPFATRKFRVCSAFPGFGLVGLLKAQLKCLDGKCLTCFITE